ncbi:MAG: SHOCT domain-containing protein [Gaiellaceae bacterium]
MLIADYPFWSVLGSMLFFFLWVIWFWLLIKVFADIFRRDDLGGGSKALWIVFVIILPYLGVFIYLITQSRHMAARDAGQMQAQKQQFDEYVKSVSGSGSGAAAEIAQAKQLLDEGTITQSEYDALKAKVLGTA